MLLKPLALLLENHGTCGHPVPTAWTRSYLDAAFHANFATHPQLHLYVCTGFFLFVPVCRASIGKERQWDAKALFYEKWRGTLRRSGTESRETCSVAPQPADCGRRHVASPGRRSGSGPA